MAAYIRPSGGRNGWVQSKQLQHGHELEYASLQGLDISDDPSYHLFYYKTNPCKISKLHSIENCHDYHNLKERRRSPTFFHYSVNPCRYVFNDNKDKIWKYPDRCLNGDACWYSHTENEQLYHPWRYKTLNCKAEPGHCPKGDACHLRHGRNDPRLGASVTGKVKTSEFLNDLNTELSRTLLGKAKIMYRSELLQVLRRKIVACGGQNSDGGLVAKVVLDAFESVPEIDAMRLIKSPPLLDLTLVRMQSERDREHFLLAASPLVFALLKAGFGRDAVLLHFLEVSLVDGASDIGKKLPPHINWEVWRQQHLHFFHCVDELSTSFEDMDQIVKRLSDFIAKEFAIMRKDFLNENESGKSILREKPNSTQVISKVTDEKSAKKAIPVQKLKTPLVEAMNFLNSQPVLKPSCPQPEREESQSKKRKLNQCPFVASASQAADA